MTAEYWKPVPGYEGLYEVSYRGEVRRVPGPRAKKYRILRPGLSKKGYLVVSLCKNSKAKTFSVHRLVASVFVLGDSSLVVNHKDGNPKNNSADNLEYVTQKRNVEHAYASGLNPTKIPYDLRQTVKARIESGERQVDIAREFNCSPSVVHYLVHN